MCVWCAKGGNPAPRTCTCCSVRLGWFTLIFPSGGLHCVPHSSVPAFPHGITIQSRFQPRRPQTVGQDSVAISSLRVAFHDSTCTTILFRQVGRRGVEGTPPTDPLSAAWQNCRVDRGRSDILRIGRHDSCRSICPVPFTHVISLMPIDPLVACPGVDYGWGWLTRKLKHPRCRSALQWGIFGPACHISGVYLWSPCFQIIDETKFSLIPGGRPQRANYPGGFPRFEGHAWNAHTRINDACSIIIRLAGVLWFLFGLLFVKRLLKLGAGLVWDQYSGEMVYFSQILTIFIQLHVVLCGFKKISTSQPIIFQKLGSKHQ